MGIKNRLSLYKKGEHKYAHEFDAVQFSKNMRNIKALIASLLDDNEKYMIKNQKTNVLLLQESSSEEDLSDQDKVPKLFSKLVHKVIHRVKVKKKMVR